MTERNEALVSAAPGRDTIVLTRVFDAPPEIVFEAWTSPVHLARWWGPKGFTTTTHAYELAVGRGWRFTMHGPDGTDYPTRTVYREIARAKRLVYAHYELEGTEVLFETTVTFEPDGRRTKLTMSLRFASAAARDHVIERVGAIEGGKQTLGRLADHLAAPKLVVVADPNAPTIVTRRVVDAPRALVFDAFTKPEHLRRWMGPRALEMVVCDVDLRVGGTWRMVYRAPDGSEVGFHGAFREVERPERVVRTFVFEPMPDDEAIETFVLDELDGKTTITTTTVHRSMAGRDGHLKHGMEVGMTEGYARLDELLATLRSAS